MCTYRRFGAVDDCFTGAVGGLVVARAVLTE